LAALSDHPVYLKTFDPPQQADHDQQTNDGKNDSFFHMSFL